MSSSDLAIRVSGLSKAYTIRHQAEQHITLAEQVLSRVRHPFQKADRETFWALRDVDLEVKRGEVLGIIGRNGAGKSTLLKVLSRITAPTAGRVELYGRLGSLLEVGTGFHAELTGRENIYLNGTILGMKRAEIDRRFDEIVEFAGVSQFLDTPVKRYSSGMYVRLAFAVAAHLDTEILVLDEVLAVGDQDFQRRSEQRMAEVVREGRSVLFVSHQLSAVQNICSQVAWLHAGRVLRHGPTADLLTEYKVAADRELDESPTSRYIESCALLNTRPAPGQELRFRFRLAPRPAGERFFLSAQIADDDHRVVAQLDSRLSGLWVESAPEAAEVDLSMRSPWLKPGRYRLDTFICDFGIKERIEGALSFWVSEETPYPTPIQDEAIRNVTVLADFAYSLRTATSEAGRP